MGELLIDAKIVHPQDVEKALQLQAAAGGRLGTILFRTGALSEEALLRVLALQLDAPVLGVDAPIPDESQMLQGALESGIPLDWFLDQRVLMWQMPDGTIGWTAQDPLASLVLQSLAARSAGAPLAMHLARRHDIDRCLDYLGRERAMDELATGTDKALRELAEEAPIIELVNNILSQAVEAKASDIHIEAGESLFVVRIRVDGVLHQRMTQPMDRFAAVASRIKLISGADIAERRLPQDGRMSTRVSGREFDVRVSTAPDVHGESIVLRLPPKERADLDLEHLGMEPDHLALMGEWAREAHGIILVTGPTGSGKSTTLYSMLTAANDGIRKMITVEDPVEFQLSGITQIQARADIGYTFARAARNPAPGSDVIMIGEIRDLETAEIAIQAALTGHLVLSTLHTNDAASAFTRLINMGIEPFLAAAPVRGLQAQRLVRMLCHACREPCTVPQNILDEVSAIVAWSGEQDWHHARGCKACQGTGYRGRTGIYEMIPVDEQLQALVARNIAQDQIKSHVLARGWRTLRQDGLLKASRGISSVEEVMRVVSH
ncbi:MAG: type II/IV secretion system protein [Gammaproteobacteria bacterium]|nr:type II/IV secretion system protein [Gammaproteobacteria bacterium]